MPELLKSCVGRVPELLKSCVDDYGATRPSQVECGYTVPELLKSCVDIAPDLLEAGAIELESCGKFVDISFVKL